MGHGGFGGSVSNAVGVSTLGIRISNTVLLFGSRVPWLHTSPHLQLRHSSSEIRADGSRSRETSLFAPFPGATPRLMQTQRDSSLSSCLQTANQEQCLTVRNNYLASFALSTFQIQKGDKGAVPTAQERR